MTSAMIPVALVGFGLSGRYLQAPFFLAHPHFTVRTVVTQHSDPSGLLPGVRVERSLAAALADPAIQLVSICSPNATHYAYARAALEAGKHVLVEKPLTATVAEASDLIALAERQGLVLSVFQNRRWDSDFLTVQNIVAAGLLGELLRYESRFDRYRPEPSPKRWKERPDPATSALYDLGAHLIDQALTLFGPPQRVWGQVLSQRPDSTIADAFEVRLDYGLLQVQLQSSLLVREESPRHALYGREGAYVKYGLDVQEDQLRAGLAPTAPDFGQEPADRAGLLHTTLEGAPYRGPWPTARGHWAALFANLHAAITSGAPLAVTARSILPQLRIIEHVHAHPFGAVLEW